MQNWGPQEGGFGHGGRPQGIGSGSAASGASAKQGGGQRGRNDICVGEEVKIAVNIALERFRLSEEQKELEFPSSLSSTERAYIHKLCESFGFKSKSKGKGSNRYLTVIKKEGNAVVESVATFQVVRNSRHQIHSLLQRFPLSQKERQELVQRTERSQYNDLLSKEMTKTTTGRLNKGVPQIPGPKLSSDLAHFRQTLPVYQMREALIRAINDNKVILVAGDTGCGKTTQIPQLILDDCQATGRPCRIFCTQPRRLSALSVAERVAAERGEKIGQTVGYQIRLESRVSPKTLLTFCTNGVLLRTLMGGEQALTTVTHVIVDEIHERDRFSDFLLIVLREVLPRIKTLKLILMSAALNTQLFSTYFYNCPIISVPGQLFEVQTFYLEDVLKWTGYTNKDMNKRKQELSKVTAQRKNLDDLIDKPVNHSLASSSSSCARPVSHISAGARDARAGGDSTTDSIIEEPTDKEQLEDWLIKEMDQLLTDAWLSGKEEDYFSQIFHLILNERVSVDYVHSETSVTALMVCCGRGFLNSAEQLLNLGASVKLRSSNDWTALDWAQRMEQNELIELLEAHIGATDTQSSDDMDQNIMKQSTALSAEDKELLNLYHSSFDDDRVDINLILALLHKIHSSQQHGAVLVFLPGYDEIVMLRDKINEDKAFSDSNRYIVYILHSHVQSSDQKRVFKNPGAGVRKIILATNIAETSITIDDVVYVIDSGKVKEKSYDALTSVSMLKSHWISKASALQRKGRAGRCRAGYCYHLFSRARYDSMAEYQDPEILRYPLQELCLHTKLLAPVNCQIADFLAKAPEPPAFLLTRNAVHLLKQIDALDPFEDLTELGHHLSDLPVEPRYGKMILYSVVLKCLDPVLTIACALAYKDPFLMPSQPYQKRAAAMARRKFASNTFSDHMAFLQAFQGWQKARTEGWERSFCDRNFLSSSTMEMIVGMRTQLLGQLRASGFVRARGGGDIRDLNCNSENWAVVKAALCAGLYPHVVRVDRVKGQLVTMKASKVGFHNTSVLSAGPNEVTGGKSEVNVVNRLPTDWLVFEEMTRAYRTVQVKSCTVVSPITIALFAGAAKLPIEVVREAEGLSAPPNLTPPSNPTPLSESLIDSSDSESETGATRDSAGPKETEGVKTGMTWLRLDEWIMFNVDTEAASLIMQLREKWHSLFMRRMRGPTKHWSHVDESTIRTVVGVLTNEEQALGLQQPAGIGQRPRPMSTDSSVSSGGATRQGSWDSSVPNDQSDDSNGSHSNGSSKHRKKGQGHSRDDQSETSSARSTASNGSNGSYRGSEASSPSYSPVLGGPVPQSKASEPQGGFGSGPRVYFVVRVANNRILQISEQRGVWATSDQGLERKLSNALTEGKIVYVVFTMGGSSSFHGVARLVSLSNDKIKEFHSAGLGSTFHVEWLKRYPDHGNSYQQAAKTYLSTLSFQLCQHLSNPGESTKIIQAKDGQELSSTVADELIRLWDRSQEQQLLQQQQQLQQLHLQQQQQQQQIYTHRMQQPQQFGYGMPRAGMVNRAAFYPTPQQMGAWPNRFQGGYWPPHQFPPQRGQFPEEYGNFGHFGGFGDFSGRPMGGYDTLGDLAHDSHSPRLTGPQGALRKEDMGD